jgi:hypothetical protein
MQDTTSKSNFRDSPPGLGEITCLGHLARIHGTLDLNAVLPLLEILRQNPQHQWTIDNG